ncbi:E3 ubiquitin-protein ligase SP1-like [Trifolium pratense]|uniref:Uncharacterized protein n=1 Tax=Trifolium pratense TaxID=57577 RepID=A0ACB0IBE5_TRIPR|nr:E3 ubiquitin-protein ligase SP1-like [Trifolium pratense]CAJ2629270.1 unnamed protein product [Trifolium pratense]
MACLFVVGSIVYFSGAALYIFAGKHVREARILKSVTRVNQLKDLAQLLDEEISPLAVTISGEVASENPMKCEIANLRGVIAEETVEKIYLKNEDFTIRQKEKCNCVNHNKTCNVAWTLHSEFISSIPKEVPWYLDDGTDRVYVVGARFATDFVLPVRRSKFDELGQTLVGETSYHIQDIKILGLKRIERVLPVGTLLTVVGEASKDDDGTIRIQQPPKGPFYVSCKMIDEHIADFEGSARLCKYISMGLTTIGASLIAKNAIGSRG